MKETVLNFVDFSSKNHVLLKVGTVGSLTQITNFLNDFNVLLQTGLLVITSFTAIIGAIGMTKKAFRKSKNSN